MSERLKAVQDSILTADEVLKKQDKSSQDYYESDLCSLLSDTSLQINDMVSAYLDLAVVNTFGKSPKAIRSAIEVLEQKGYLVEIEFNRLVIKIVEPV